MTREYGQDTINDPYKHKILIVDDNPLNLILLETLLRNEGYQTLKAHSGPEARLLAHQQFPDLILLDIMMPEEDGITTCRLLKQDPLVEDIPVIFLSALEDSGTKVSGLSLGAVDYITKPFDKGEVLARVKLQLNIRDKYISLSRRQSDMLDNLQQAQQDILVRPADMPDALFAVCFRPKSEVGGDFYDVVNVADGCHDYFVADISGHDLAASFNTSALKALFRQSTGAADSPMKAMRRINNGVMQIFKDGMHLTACLLHLDRVNSMVTLVNAGHLPVIHLDCASGRTSLIKAEGDIIGAFEDIVLSEQVVKVARGDRLFLYTDGLVEKTGIQMDRIEGISALAQVCSETQSIPVAEAVSTVCDRLFQTTSSPLDDIILLGIEV